MKFKKTVSALAVMAAATMAFAVSASAADKYEVLYGTTTTDGTGAITAVAPQADFTADDTGYLESATTMTFVGETFVEGSALKGSFEKDFAAPISTGKVHITACYNGYGGANNTNGGVFSLVDSDGNNVVIAYPGDKNGSATLSLLDLNGASAATGWIYTPRNVSYKLDLELDLDAKKANGTVRYPNKGSSGTVKELTNATITDYSISSLKDIKGIKVRKDGIVDNIALYSVQSAETKYDYKVQYVFEGNAVRTEEFNGTAGSTIVPDMDAFWVGDQKYYCVSADENVTVATDGSAVAKVTVRKANTYTANVTLNYADTSEKLLDNRIVVEGEALTYTIPKYKQAGTTVYEIAAEKTNAGYFKHSVSNVTADIDDSYNYDKAVYENVAYFEDLEGSTGNSADVRASNGSAYDNQAYKTAELGPGEYTVYLNAMNKGRNSTFVLGDTVVYDNAARITKNSWGTPSFELTVTEKAALVWTKGSAYDPIDTILIVKKPATAPEVTVTKDSEYTEEGSNPAALYLGKYTAKDEYTVKTVNWTVNVGSDNYKTATDVMTAVSGEADVTVGLVVTAADLGVITGVSAVAE